MCERQLQGLTFGQKCGDARLATIRETAGPGKETIVQTIQHSLDQLEGAHDVKRGVCQRSVQANLSSKARTPLAWAKGAVRSLV